MNAPLDRIAELAALLAGTDIDSLELAGPSGRVLLRRGSAGGIEAPAGPALSASEPAKNEITVASPGIGRFLRAHPLREAPLTEEGEEVVRGQPLALVQVGAVLMPVPSPAAGTIAAVRREDGALTGFGDPLFDILPTEASR